MRYEVTDGNYPRRLVTFEGKYFSELRVYLVLFWLRAFVKYYFYLIIFFFVFGKTGI